MYLAVRNLQARICVPKTSSNKYFHCYLERFHALEGEWNEAASIWMRQIDITNLQFCCKDWARIVKFSNFLKMLKAYQTEIRYNFIVMTWKIAWKFWFSCMLQYHPRLFEFCSICWVLLYTLYNAILHIQSLFSLSSLLPALGFGSTQATSPSVFFFWIIIVSK